MFLVGLLAGSDLSARFLPFELSLDLFLLKYWVISIGWI